MQSNRLRKQWHHLREKKARSFYERLKKREYVSPSGYPAFDSVLKEYGALLYLVNAEIADLDMGQRKTGMILSQLYHHDYPVFWVSEPLMEALKHTRLPKLDYGQMPLFMPYGMIILPDACTLESSNGGKVRAIAFRFVEQADYASAAVTLPGGRFECAIGDAETSRKLLYTAISLNGDGLYWSGMIGLGAETIQIGDRTEMMLEDGQVIAGKTDARLVHEEQHMEAIVHFLLNLCLLQAAKPALFDASDVSVQTGASRMHGVSGVGFKPVGARWAPRWIGKDYQIKTSQPKAPKPGEPSSSRHSPRPHWRSGHHQTVWRGPGRAWLHSNWIEPIYINAHRLSEFYSQKDD